MSARARYRRWRTHPSVTASVSHNLTLAAELSPTTNTAVPRSAAATRSDTGLLLAAAVGTYRARRLRVRAPAARSGAATAAPPESAASMRRRAGDKPVWPCHADAWRCGVPATTSEQGARKGGAARAVLRALSSATLGWSTPGHPSGFRGVYPFGARPLRRLSGAHLTPPFRLPYRVLGTGQDVGERCGPSARSAARRGAQGAASAHHSLARRARLARGRVVGAVAAPANRGIALTRARRAPPA